MKAIVMYGAGGVDKDVTFVEESIPSINDQIDAAYRTKYRRYAASIIGSIVSPEARSRDNQTRAVLNKLVVQQSPSQ